MSKALVDGRLWEIIEPLIPVMARRTRSPGRKRLDNRKVLTEIIICIEDGHSLGRLAPRDGMWVRDELLAAFARMVGSRGMGEVAQNVAGEIAGEREDRLGALSGGQFIGTRGFGGEETGPNPTDRGKSGSNRPIVTDVQGIPLAVTLTAANAHDVTQLLPVIDAIPPARGQSGRPCQRPEHLFVDRGYDSEPHRQALASVPFFPVSLTETLIMAVAWVSFAGWLNDLCLGFINSNASVFALSARLPSIAPSCPSVVLSFAFVSSLTLFVRRS